MKTDLTFFNKTTLTKFHICYITSLTYILLYKLYQLTFINFTLKN